MTNYNPEITTTMAALSILSDIQEEYPDLRVRINVVKRLIFQIDDGVKKLRFSDIDKLYDDEIERAKD